MALLEAHLGDWSAANDKPLPEKRLPDITPPEAAHIYLVDRPGSNQATVIAGKDAATIRAAKASLNGIDPIDVRRSYRYEQGFTYELNLRGIGDTAREAFLRGERGGEAPSA